ncbi:hypothetical protein PoB_001089300 [Plakobranchus ocellatus]|uniref:Uncharacterized protein n=1 Tax=Plakobranchus ocellatus TaxID=259542 RepID=A0AAV3YPW6_9GAST|nr:hypothetical protein PoB_001089300 [Plakobranchus ocellatus]
MYFGYRNTKGQLSAKELDEINGIAASCVLSDIVIAHNYEGDGNLFMLWTSTRSSWVSNGDHTNAVPKRISKFLS